MCNRKRNLFLLEIKTIPAISNLRLIPHTLLHHLEEWIRQLTKFLYPHQHQHLHLLQQETKAIRVISNLYNNLYNIQDNPPISTNNNILMWLIHTRPLEKYSNRRINNQFKVSNINNPLLRSESKPVRAINSHP